MAEKTGRRRALALHGSALVRVIKTARCDRAGNAQDHPQYQHRRDRTSLTIDGVSTVIDSGRPVRSVRYDPARGVDRWSLERISRASADQHAGRRAGRTGPGRCVRLWSEPRGSGLAAFAEPEIRRVDLSSTLLALARMGIERPVAIPVARAARRRPAGRRRATPWRCSAPVEEEPARITPSRPSNARDARSSPPGPPAARDVGMRPSERRRGSRRLAGGEKDIRVRDTGIFTNAAGRASSPQVTAPSDILVRLDSLAEAEAVRFSPSIRSRGLDPSAARQVARNFAMNCSVSFPEINERSYLGKTRTATTRS